MKDREIWQLIKSEARRQDETINLIASENFVSNDIICALGSPLVNKYAEGYSGLRYYCGNIYIDAVEDLCKKRALKLFGLSPKKWHVNVQPYSGSPANFAVYLALVPMGGKIMGLRLDMGGHLTHGHKVSATGKIWQPVPYTVDRKTDLLDYKAIRALAVKEKPQIIVAGCTAYPRTVDFGKFRKIADAVGAYLLADISHIAGLIAGKMHPSPFPYADVVMTTLHKTMRGPRAAVIFVDKKSRVAKRAGVDIAKAIDRAVFPGCQGGPHVNQIAATAVAFHEADTARFRNYARQMVKNARALGGELQKLGWRLISGGTDTHLILVDVAARGLGSKEASTKLEAQGIIVNKNAIPYDPRPPMDPSGIRLGTPALTSRGMKEEDMRKIARMIDGVLLRGENVRADVKRLCRKYPLWYKV